jgi:hypothetical protein
MRLAPAAAQASAMAAPMPEVAVPSSLAGTGE